MSDEKMVEETLNAMLDAEADRLCGAGRYERSEGRQDTRAGSYDGRCIRRRATSASSWRIGRRHTHYRPRGIRRSLAQVGQSVMGLAICCSFGVAPMARLIRSETRDSEL